MADTITSNSLKKITLAVQQYTITDSSFGFISSGLSSVTYLILGAYCFGGAGVNLIVDVSQANNEYRFQLRAGTNQSIEKSGSHYIWYAYVKRSDITEL